MKDMSREKPSAIILAGGKGRRLGRDKTTLLLKGETILGWLVSLISRLDFLETFVVYGEKIKSSGLPVLEVGDLLPGTGSLGGIYTGLSYSSSDLNFVIACDMPFPSLPLIRHLLERSASSRYDCVIPRNGNYLEPLFAVYRKTCIPVIRDQIQQGHLRIAEILPSLNPLLLPEIDLDRFDPRRLSFFNINTADDLIRAETLLGEFEENVDR